MTFKDKDSPSKRRPATLTVAVTGGAGSGKSAVCRRLGTLGCARISADEIARKVVSAGSAVLKEISDHFGAGILLPDGSLNRSKLRRIILGDETLRRRLEGIVHPAILSRMRQEIRETAASGGGIVVAEVPLLFELNLAREFDVVVLVTADPPHRAGRLVRRDGVSFQEAERLIGTQLPDAVKIAGSDHIIKNTGSLEDLNREVDALYARLKEKFADTS